MWLRSYTNWNPLLRTVYFEVRFIPRSLLWILFSDGYRVRVYTRLYTVFIQDNTFPIERIIVLFVSSHRRASPSRYSICFNIHCLSLIFISGTLHPLTSHLRLSNKWRLVTLLVNMDLPTHILRNHSILFDYFP